MPIFVVTPPVTFSVKFELREVSFAVRLSDEQLYVVPETKVQPAGGMAAYVTPLSKQARPSKSSWQSKLAVSFLIIAINMYRP